MSTPVNNKPQTPPTPSETKDFLVKWTPRLIVATLAGYYSLGAAYDYGVMASIDKVAIRLLKHWVGYAGIGAAMPTFQWYAAWAVRCTAAAAGGITYDFIEKTALYFYGKLRPKTSLQTLDGLSFSSLSRA